MNKSIPIHLAIILCSFSTTLKAAESIVLSGYESGHENKYGYLGFINPMPGSTLGNGLVSRVYLDYLEYSYDGGVGKVDVESPGISISMGRQGKLSSYSYGLHLGASYRNNLLSPKDPSNDNSGPQTSPMISVELMSNPEEKGNKKIFLNASYLPKNQAYWYRGRVLIPTGFYDLYLGPEIMLQGDNNYKKNSYGMILSGFKFQDSFEYNLKAGSSRVENEHPYFYFGVEITGVVD